MELKVQGSTVFPMQCNKARRHREVSERSLRSLRGLSGLGGRFRGFLLPRTPSPAILKSTMVAARLNFPCVSEEHIWTMASGG